ncbi:dTMP kinase [Litoribacillus peritrichatus]|uniref:Thymidylate kinase n=1 Tax=Litoribacillus peritrichatus TaxID=718191 RepID=A0ABP7N3P9_9GAMM
MRGLKAVPKALFITFEGGEGVGKTTNIEYFKRLMADACLDYVATREPGGTPLAEEIRNLLLAPRDEKVCSNAELLLMFAARAQHLSQFIEPSLQRGEHVVCDRFTDATYAYQGYGRELGVEAISVLENLVHGNRQPDLTVILDAPVEVGMARARARGDLDRFEQENLSFFERVREGYLLRASQNPDRYAVVDASLSLDKVQNQVKQVFEDRVLRVISQAGEAS